MTTTARESGSSSARVRRVFGGKKDFSEKINRIGAMNLQKTEIPVLELNGNKHHFLLPRHLIRR